MSYSKLLSLYRERKFEDLEKTLIEAVREESEKAAGRKASENAIIKRMLKGTSKSYNKILQKQHAFNFSGKEYYAILDGHYLLAREESFNIDTAEPHERLTAEKFFEELSRTETAVIKCDIAKIKFFLKQEKALKQKGASIRPYVMQAENGGLIAVNPEMLADCLEFCGSDELIYYCDMLKPGACYKSTLYVKSESESKLALLLPVCINGDKLPEYMEEYK